MPYKDKAKTKEASRRHYERNRSAVIGRVQEKREVVRRIKEETPCADCGLRFPYYVMDFDHLFDKSFGISKAIKSKGLDSVLAEIEKCEVVCASCHRQRTHDRHAPMD